jgi:glutamate racemase
MNHPIGIFDSGLGGISIWKEIVKMLPHEDLIYFADSGNCPYGNKSHEEILNLSDRITQFLLFQGCKMIVVACNTATAAAIDYLREQYKVPFIGIEPAVKPAAENTKTGSIGILATKGTFEGRLFKKTKKQYADDISVQMQVGEGLVEIVEQNKIHTPYAFDLISTYIQPMLEAKADQIVLGCTHYPFLAPVIDKITAGKANVINPAPAVARQTKHILKKENLNRSKNKKPKYEFYTSGEERILAEFLAQHTDLPFSINVYFE